MRVPCMADGGCVALNAIVLVCAQAYSHADVSFHQVCDTLTTALAMSAQLTLCSGGLGPDLQLHTACVRGCVQLMASILVPQLPEHAAAHGNNSKAGSGQQGTQVHALSTDVKSRENALFTAVQSIVQEQLQALPAPLPASADAGTDPAVRPKVNIQVGRFMSNAVDATPHGVAADPACQSSANSTDDHESGPQSDGAGMMSVMRPAIQLLCCYPVALVADESCQLRVHVDVMDAQQQEAEGIGYRLVLYSCSGCVVADVSNSLPADGRQRFHCISVDVPALPAGVLHVAVFAGHNQLVITQPLLVLPGAAAAEIQSVWVSMLKQVQASKATQHGTSGQEDDGTKTSSKGHLLNSTAHSQVRQAWSQRLTPLLTDMAYVMSTLSCRPAARGGMVPASGGKEVMGAVSTHLLEFLAACGMWSCMQLVLTYISRSTQDAQASTHAQPATSNLALPTTLQRMLAPVLAVTSSVTDKVSAEASAAAVGVDRDYGWYSWAKAVALTGQQACSSIVGALTAGRSAVTSKAAATAQPSMVAMSVCRSTVPMAKHHNCGDVACAEDGCKLAVSSTIAGNSKLAVEPLTWRQVLLGFNSTISERQYLIFKHTTTALAALAGNVYHLLLGLSSGYLSSRSTFPYSMYGIGMVMWSKSFGFFVNTLFPGALFAIRPRMAGTPLREYAVTAWEIMSAMQTVLYGIGWLLPPPMLYRALSPSDAAVHNFMHDLIFLFGIGLLRPVARQVSRRRFSS